jgi:hypothetical protein
MQGIRISEQNTVKKFCPYFEEPFDSCYCTRLTSQKIKKMLHFCRDYFESCENYRTKY